MSKENDKNARGKGQGGEPQEANMPETPEEQPSSSPSNINIHLPPPEKPESAPSPLPPWVTNLIQLGIFGMLVTIGIWVGTISTTVKENGETLKKIDTAVLDPNTGMSVRLARIETTIEDIRKKVDGIEKSISMPQIRQEIDQRQIDQLKMTISRLQLQLNQVSGRLSQAQSELNRRPRETVSEAQLSAIDQELRSLRIFASDPPREVPEPFIKGIQNRIENIQKEFDQLKRQVRG